MTREQERCCDHDQGDAQVAWHQGLEPLVFCICILSSLKLRPLNKHTFSKLKQHKADDDKLADMSKITVTGKPFYALIKGGVQRQSVSSLKADIRQSSAAVSSCCLVTTPAFWEVF
jgi:hypothetical protein